MGFSGRLEGIAPSDIFQIISQSRMTGTLIARCQEGTAMVVFKNGQVIEAASDAPRESLGSLLVSQGLMSEETIAAARARRKLEPDRPLGTLLVDMGAISEQTLESVVLRQIANVVHRLVACEDGFFTFDSGEMALKRKLNTREFFLPAGVSAEYLMMERVRALDEERRTGTDRRAHPRPAVEAEPERAAFRAAREQVRSAPPAAVGRLVSWFRAIRLPKTEQLRSAAGTVVQGAKRISGSAADWLRRTVQPRLRTVWNKALAFSPDGRAMIFTGIGTIAAGIVLILLATFTFSTTEGELVITGRVVNLRAKPTTRSTVVAKVERGETVSPVSIENGWHEVRTKEGAVGWVWKNLVEQQEQKAPAIGYAMTAFVLVLIPGVALLVTGFLRKRRTAPQAPLFLRKEV